MNLFETGIRPAVDAYLKAESEKVRDYGEYFSASSAGYCMRKVIFDRLKVPQVTEDARKTRVFESGHIFHEWMQRITKNAGLSVAQEIELQDEDLMIRGHIDDLAVINDKPILYDYKTQHSRAFQWAKKTDRDMSHFHRMQLGTYMYMIRKLQKEPLKLAELDNLPLLEEARIMKISKDDLCMLEEQLLWSPKLEKDVVGYWRTLNGYWKKKQLPKCTCADYENGFMAKPQYNPYYFKEEPCSIEWLKLKKQEGAVTW
jgi:hypothetical protein